MLPDVSRMSAAGVVMVQKSDASANAVTIYARGGTIAGATSYTISEPGESVLLFWDSKSGYCACAGRHAELAGRSATGSHPATAISYDPPSGVTADDVQAAIDALWVETGAISDLEEDQLLFGSSTGHIAQSARYKTGTWSFLGGGKTGYGVLLDDATHGLGASFFALSDVAKGHIYAGIGIASGGSNAPYVIDYSGATSRFTHTFDGDIEVDNNGSISLTGGTYNIGGVPHRHDSWYSAIGHHHPWSQIDEIPEYVPTESPGLAPVLVWADVGGDGDHVYGWTNLDNRYSLTTHTHNNATTTVAGFMSGADKTKLDGLANYTHPATHPQSILEASGWITTALAGKADSGHSHAHGVTSGYVPVSGGGAVWGDSPLVVSGGRVGVGGAATYPLEVFSTVLSTASFTNTNGTTPVCVYAKTGNGSYRAAWGVDTSGAFFGSNSGHPLSLMTGDVTRMSVAADGSAITSYTPSWAQYDGVTTTESDVGHWLYKAYSSNAVVRSATLYQGFYDKGWFTDVYSSLAYGNSPIYRIGQYSGSGTLTKSTVQFYMDTVGMGHFSNGVAVRSGKHFRMYAANDTTYATMNFDGTNAGLDYPLVVAGNISANGGDLLATGYIKASSNGLVLRNSSSVDAARIKYNDSGLTISFDFAGVPKAWVDQSGNLCGTNLTASATFTATLTGFATNPTCTASYQIVGDYAYLSIPTATGTSNATTLTLTGIPVEARPASGQAVLSMCSDDGGVRPCRVAVGTDGVATFQLYSTATNQYSSIGFTSSGVKGVTGTITLIYKIR
jgi:hypothetical protein